MSGKSARAVEARWLAALVTVIVTLAAVRPALGAPLITVRDGKLTARISAVPLADLKGELASFAAVDVRVASEELASHTVTATLVDEGIAKALDSMLRDFNFVQFTDIQSGRSTYLVTSLADPTKRTTALRSEVGGSAGVTSMSSTAKPRSLDDLRPIVPATFDAYAPQSIIEEEMARVSKETLDRAHSLLNDPANAPELQQQALNELAGIGDPRSLQTLRQLIIADHVLKSPQAADAVAQATWRYAATLQFANADANRLLQAMAASTQPQMRSIGEAALRDLQNYLAQHPSR